MNHHEQNISEELDEKGYSPILNSTDQFVANISIVKKILIKLKLWSLLVLPLCGFAIGKIIYYYFSSQHLWKYNALVVHGITMIFMIITLNDLIFNPITNTTNITNITITTSITTNIVEEKILFVCISYLFVLGVIFGIIISI